MGKMVLDMVKGLPTRKPGRTRSPLEAKFDPFSCLGLDERVKKDR